jgi:serine/threonine protein kinase/tetratricopeptide (TPR) repeat protein
MIGTTLSHYRIVEKIGEGGMGVVYRARDTALDRDVAVKVLPEDLAEDPERLARFEREAKTLAALNHPNIATVFGFETVDSGAGLPPQTFLAMELLEGESLRELISKDGLTIGKAVEYARTIADGLAAAHDKGIIHRDLKPENVFLTRDGRIKILDFGLAKLLLPEEDLTTETPTATLHTAPGRLLGTVAYMAPEQVEGQAADHGSDIFALGVVLYEMLTGHRPFRGSSSAATAAAILKEDPEPISATAPGIPSTLAGVVSKCLEKRPQDRFSSAHDLSLTLGAIDTAAAPAAPGRSVIGKRWPHILAVVVAAVIALLVILPPEAIFDRFMGRDESSVPYGDRSIAVLPFLNMSDDAGNEYFSDGISEELLNLLAKITELRVISRSSAFSYKGREIKAAQVAEELKVAHILEGSVRKAGSRVRITAQLIEARTDTHLWSETYDRTLDDVFAVQDEIAAAVVDQLKVKLLGEAPRVEETDPEAYALHLQARHLGRQRAAEALEQSNALYQEVLEIDPDYGDAWLGLAANYTSQAAYGLLTSAEGSRLAREAATRGLAIDPDNPRAHARLGRIARSFDGDLTAAARHLSRALALDPSDIETLSSAAILVRSLARPDEAVTIMEYVVARDPVNARSHQRLGAAYYYAGRFDEAIASQRTALKLSPGSVAAHSSISLDLMLKGEPEAALAEIQQEPSHGYRLLGLAMVHHALGQVADSEAVLQQLIEIGEKDWAYNLAYVHAYLGRVDEAFDWLNKAVENDDMGLADLPVAVWLFRNLHEDPRWLPFLESIGKSPAQLAAIEFEVTLPG